MVAHRRRRDGRGAPATVRTLVAPILAPCIRGTVTGIRTAPLASRLLRRESGFVSPVSRDPEGRPRAGTSWRGIAEQQIAEAMERGDFDGLAHHGRPLPKPDDDHASDMALAFSILRNAGVAPPWIEADKEVRRLLHERDRALASAWRSGRGPWPFERQRFADLIARINTAIDGLNATAPTARQHRLRLKPDAELAAYEHWHEREAPDAPDDEPGQAGAI